MQNFMQHFNINPQAWQSFLAAQQPQAILRTCAIRLMFRHGRAAKMPMPPNAVPLPGNAPPPPMQARAPMPPQGAPAGIPGAPWACQWRPLHRMPAPKWHDVTIVRKKKRKQARVLGVPPEEFGIARNARSLRDCGYCFHEVLKRQEELLADGYDEAQINALPTYNMLQNPEELSRDTVDEHLAAGGDGGINDANRTLKITEHYIRLDYEQNGKIKLYRITTGGEQGEILKRDGEPEIIQEDFLPFAAMTPVIITHRFFGRSIADLVMDIQRIKTALYRGILDNAYLTNNPRAEVAESGATDNTLDDLLVSRPGGVVRVRQSGTVNWQQIPFAGQEMLPVVEYVDATREWRTGVSRAGQGLDANALQNQSATAANQLFTAAQARMKLIARIFAETGIKDLFQLLHKVVRKHGGAKQTVRLRNKWVDVDPREWDERQDMTVNVGLGTGGKAEQLVHLQTIIAAQVQAIQGGVGIVSKENLYNSGKRLCQATGFKNTDEFFIDPSKPPDPRDPNSAPIPPPPDPAHAKVQADAQAAQAKTQADAAHQQMKTQADAAFQKAKLEMDAQMAQKKHDLDAQLAVLKFQLEERKTQHEMTMKEHEHTLTAEAQRQDTEARIADKREPKATIAVKHGARATDGAACRRDRQIRAVFGRHARQARRAAEPACTIPAAHQQAMQHMIETMSAPRRIVRGPDGRVSHSEVVKH